VKHGIVLLVRVSKVQRHATWFGTGVRSLRRTAGVLKDQCNANGVVDCVEEGGSKAWLFTVPQWISRAILL
jgi:hypothetical protein